MKRIVAAMLTVFLTGCAVQPSEQTVTNRMNGAFTAEVTIRTADSEITGTLQRYGTDAWCVVFSEPAALDGVQLDFVDDEVTASYKGLEFSVPQTAQAVRTELQELMEVVDGMAAEQELTVQEQDEQLTCGGELEVGAYTLSFGEDGTPLGFSLPAYGLEITFGSFVQQGAAQPVAPTQPETPTQPEAAVETQ